MHRKIIRTGILLVIPIVIALYNYQRSSSFVGPSTIARSLSSEANSADYVQDLSAFPEFISLNGDNIPFPFENLSQILTKKTPNQNRPTTPILIPFGRSLQKGSTDFSSPRIVMSNLNRTRPIFVGYAEKAEQLEVISWNLSRGEFDFLLVKDYRQGGHPYISKPDQSICLKCHQAGGPIFSRFPWREVTGVLDPNFESSRTNLFEKPIMEAMHGKKFFHGIDLDKYFSGSNAFAQAGELDSSVRFANRRLQQNRALRFMCGSNIECRKLLLVAALAYPNRTDTTVSGREFTIDFFGPFLGFVTPPNSFLKILQKYLSATWPSNGFAQPSSVLPDRAVSFLTGGQDQGYINLPVTTPDGKVHQPVFQEAATTATLVGFSNPEYGEENFPSPEIPVPENLAYLIDPRTPRPEQLKIYADQGAVYAVTAAFKGFGFIDSDLVKLKGVTSEQMKAAFDDKSFREALVNWPPPPELVLKQVFRSLGNSQEADYYDKLLKQYAVTEESKLSAPSVSKNPKNIFVKYCSECHGTSNGIGPRLPLENIAELQKNKFIINYIKTKYMPLDLGNTVQPTDSERAEMLRLITEQK